MESNGSKTLKLETEQYTTTDQQQTLIDIKYKLQTDSIKCSVKPLGTNYLK